MDINNTGRGTPKSLIQAIEDAFALSQGPLVDAVIIDKCVKDYLAQGLAAEMIQTDSKEVVQAIERLAHKWSIKE